jgi:hypothetical protein
MRGGEVLLERMMSLWKTRVSFFESNYGIQKIETICEFTGNVEVGFDSCVGK